MIKSKVNLDEVNIDSCGLKFFLSVGERESEIAMDRDRR